MKLNIIDSGSRDYLKEITGEAEAAVSGVYGRKWIECIHDVG